MVLHAQIYDEQQHVIKDGDLVIVYENHASMKAVTVQASSRAKYGNRFGEWSIKDWIGKSFGSKVYGKWGAWVYLLAPTPELWTIVLTHRTQILYVADISLICMGLDLRPGSVVLESGTGSGSLTHSMARAVAPSGHVYSFEFHQVRCDEARKEFAQNGLTSVITLEHRDIEANGFPEALHGKADGVILDLPGPWKVVQSAACCLKPNGRFCGFSPCIEQVQRTAEQLRGCGFTDVSCVECLLRFYDVRYDTVTAPCLMTQTERAAQGKRFGKRKAGRGRQDAAADEEEPGPECTADGLPETGAGDPELSAEPAADSRAHAQRSPVATPQMMARGHTGYLLFARKLVPMSVLQGLLRTDDAAGMQVDGE